MSLSLVKLVGCSAEEPQASPSAGVSAEEPQPLVYPENPMCHAVLPEFPHYHCHQKSWQQYI